MKVSKKAEYAMQAVLAIARRATSKPVQIGELSEKEGIPVKFLEQILLTLKKAGLLRSKRGAGGGYQLDMPSSQISLGAIREVVDGSFQPLSSGSSDSGSSVEGIGILRCFEELQSLVNDHLEKFTVRELLEMERAEDTMAFDI
jgi:Rrf2 family protein